VRRPPGYGWAEQCHIVPSPLAGEGQGGGYNEHSAYLNCLVGQQEHLTVLSDPHRTNLVLGALWLPPSLSLPRKGGGNDVALTFATHDQSNSKRVWGQCGRFDQMDTL